MQYQFSERMWQIIKTLNGVNRIESLSPFNGYMKEVDGKIVVLDFNWRDSTDPFIKVLPPDVFNDLPELKEIKFEGNEIEEIPEGLFKNCDKLEDIDFSMNPLTTANLNFLNNIQGVVHLSLSGCGVSNLIYNKVPQLLSVRSLSLRGNNLIELPKNLLLLFPNLEFLSLGDSRGSNESGFDLNNIEFSYIPNLERLHLDNCNIIEVDAGLFDSLPKLTILDLSRNKIKKLYSHQFEHMENLKQLNLRWNSLSEECKEDLMSLSIDNIDIRL